MSNSQEDAPQVEPSRTRHRFFFELRDGAHVTADQDGLEFASLDEAAVQAVMSLPEVAKDVVPDRGRREVMVRVKDESGKEVLRASLTLVVERFSVL